MITSPQVPHDLTAIENMSPRELTRLVEDARALQRSAQTGAAQPLLRGRKFGLLNAAGTAGNDDIAFFDRAATELGAQVAHLQAHLTEGSAPRDIEDTAHLLGRLYDALVCQGMAPTLVHRLGAQAGIPVFDGIASTGSALALAAEQLGSAGSSADRRRFLLQALLLAAVG